MIIHLFLTKEMDNKNFFINLFIINSNPFISMEDNVLRHQILLAKLKTLQNQFENEFKIQWNAFIKKCDKNMFQAKQLNIGNHTRPFLVFLGATTNCDFDNSSILRETAQLAVSIEAIHKASVIIDDIIDGDSLRRGEKCMHTEFGEYETVFFAVCMLAQGIQHANHMLSCKGNDKLHMTTISLLCNTIYDMCHGAIQEISSDVQEQINLKHIQKIINSETIKLIENSLYIGFLYSETDTKETGDLIRDIGKRCGYIFQVMNDLEAFCNPEYIMDYKGNINSDFLRSRKNIILPYLYQACNKADKKKLLELLKNGEISFIATKKLFDEYMIKTEIFKDINDVYSSIFSILTVLRPIIYNQQWIEAFESYLEYTKNKYQKLLNM